MRSRHWSYNVFSTCTDVPPWIPLFEELPGLTGKADSNTSEQSRSLVFPLNPDRRTKIGVLTDHHGHHVTAPSVAVTRSRAKLMSTPFSCPLELTLSRYVHTRRCIGKICCSTPCTVSSAKRHICCCNGSSTSGVAVSRSASMLYRSV